MHTASQVGINEPILTVSELNSQVQQYLKEEFPRVVVEGEVTGLRAPSATGHWYFQLKDDRSILPCVMFKWATARLKFTPTNGMLVHVRARLTLYEPQGRFQAVIEFMEPQGEGALRLAFEQLKARLREQGWFEERRKKPLPKFPNNIAIISAQSGAATRDVFVNIWRRYPCVALKLVPTSVQGATAKFEITTAIQHANQMEPTPDFAILTRGGGSLEDLAPFNSEEVAKAIFESEIPIVSAIGHDVDYTIADFVADFRAATPSTAAEQVTPDSHQLQSMFTQHINKFHQIYIFHENRKLERLKTLSRLLPNPKKVLGTKEQQIDHLKDRITTNLTHTVFGDRTEFGTLLHRLLQVSPTNNLNLADTMTNNVMHELHASITKVIEKRQSQVEHNLDLLERVSPQSKLRVQSNSILASIERARMSIQSRLTKANTVFSYIRHDLHRASPITQISASTSRLFDLTRRLQNSMSQLVKQSTINFTTQSEKLNTVSPLSTLQRGFAVLSKPNQSKYGAIVRSVDDVQAGETIHTRIVDGVVVSTVSKIEEE
ncbi:MAG: exodeoxyribonuclease VII large subunit [Gammaproteobacteria bacterium]|nr:exodeoxyribonuclease VII large subunit [Gammaproteobacteria bacterium]